MTLWQQFLEPQFTAYALLYAFIGGCLIMWMIIKIKDFNDHEGPPPYA